MRPYQPVLRSVTPARMVLGLPRVGDQSVTSKIFPDEPMALTDVLSCDLARLAVGEAYEIVTVVDPDGTVRFARTRMDRPDRMGVATWTERNFRATLTEESVVKFDAQLATLAANGTTPRPVELNHPADEGPDVPVSYRFHSLPDRAGVLLLGRDRQPIAEMQQQLVEAQLALEQDYEERRQFETRYRVLMEATRDAVMFVSVATGKIIDANRAAAQLLGAEARELSGAAFAHEFEGRRRGEFTESLTSTAVSASLVPVQVTARRSRRRIVLFPSLLRAAGERMLLCRLERFDKPEPAPDALSDRLAALYHDGIDAIAFVDMTGTVEAANEAFLSLVDSPHSGAVTGRPIADFLARGALDARVLLDTAHRTGFLRAYAARIVGLSGAQVAVEIAATYLEESAKPQVVLVLRDASRLEAVRRSGVAVTESSVRSVMDLVGSASLKDIVSETTDVVERLCIETALELTRNNRVAAAELLGLSRQSLYVKLRKFEMLDPDGATDAEE